MGKIAGGEERIGGSEKELAIKNPAGEGRAESNTTRILHHD